MKTIILLTLLCSSMVFAKPTPSHNKKAVQEAVKACRDAADIKAGQRPSPAQIKQVHECMRNKGFGKGNNIPRDQRGRKVSDS